MPKFRLLLSLALSLPLLACTTPLRAAPAGGPALDSSRPPAQLTDCLQQGLQKLHIPDDFIERRDERDGSHSLAMRNPASDASGTRVEILPQADGSRLQVELNGLPLSPAWKKLIHSCSGKRL
ncbi:hypothetical protein KIF53_01985 [Chromobacterium subtsugae]|uniref:Lipoprotein n=1 Tax=Chromobacterium subtsugae TaxID=251747 RepID=A0ABS7FAT7_9NEIS|nr:MULTISPECIES: hypothetical protein [Chromobacterium]KUM03921.1 hypothetical protein Cv017_17085 [Chromobacterium subtsugae]KZE86621.1 hypothetical protein AWB61_00650 [Chromobacterium sp. F49]MBW7565064.1 hypothetical protein [Chromobacterium subtsugae]MBW8286408.1 hypothetical protein [Chromobacterium subtsugae]OBU87740.1 hypothetical protein MY55_02720 [Chromobacterium subtsugae]